jgi:hypothetical protein
VSRHHEEASLLKAGFAVVSVLGVSGSAAQAEALDPWLHYVAVASP